MISIFLGRLGIALTLIMLSAGAYRWYFNQVSTQAMKQSLPKTDHPTILFFSTPDCTVCHVVQAPALTALKNELQDKIEIIEIDASEEPELAKDWKVLSVPTLVVLNTKGELAFIKHGAHSAANLLAEIQPLV